MDVLCQFHADVLGVTVRRPAVQETTALGAAYLAGIAEGVWATPAEAASAWREEASLTPQADPVIVGALLDPWHRDVERGRDLVGTALPRERLAGLRFEQLDEVVGRLGQAAAQQLGRARRDVDA